MTENTFPFHKSMSDKSPTEQAKLAINHILSRIKTDFKVAFKLGPGSESFDLLTEAYASLTNSDLTKIRRELMDICNSRERRPIPLLFTVVLRPSDNLIDEIDHDLPDFYIEKVEALDTNSAIWAARNRIMHFERMDGDQAHFLNILFVAQGEVTFIYGEEPFIS